MDPRVVIKNEEGCADVLFFGIVSVEHCFYLLSEGGFYVVRHFVNPFKHSYA